MEITKNIKRRIKTELGIEYILAAERFKEVNNDKENIYIQSEFFDGKPVKYAVIPKKSISEDELIEITKTKTERTYHQTKKVNSVDDLIDKKANLKFQAISQKGLITTVGMVTFFTDLYAGLGNYVLIHRSFDEKDISVLIMFNALCILSNYIFIKEVYDYQVLINKIRKE